MGEPTEAHLVVLGELALRPCQQAVGDDPIAQIDYLRSIVRDLKRSMADVVDED